MYPPPDARQPYPGAPPPASAAFLPPMPPADEAARRKAAYGQELERQAEENRQRKEAQKRQAAKDDARLELDALQYSKVVASRKALGGAGEPLRDASGNVVAQLRGVTSPSGRGGVQVISVCVFSMRKFCCAVCQWCHSSSE